MRDLDPQLLPDPFDYVLLADPLSAKGLLTVALAIVTEPEGVGAVVPSGLSAPGFVQREGPFAAIRLNLQTSLHETGITAKISAVWDSRGIPCNVLAGFHHDVFLCPWERRDEALALIRAMSFTSNPA